MVFCCEKVQILLRPHLYRAEITLVHQDFPHVKASHLYVWHVNMRQFISFSIKNFSKPLEIRKILLTCSMISWFKFCMPTSVHASKHLLVVVIAICVQKEMQFKPWRFHALSLEHENIQNEAIIISTTL